MKFLFVVLTIIFLSACTINNGIVSTNSNSASNAQDREVDENGAEKVNENFEEVLIPKWKKFYNEKNAIEFQYPERFEYKVTGGKIEFRNVNFSITDRSEPTPEFLVLVDEVNKNINLCDYAKESNASVECEDITIQNRVFVFVKSGEMYPVHKYFLQSNNKVITFSFYQKGQKIGIKDDEITQLIGTLKIL